MRSSKHLLYIFLLLLLSTAAKAQLYGNEWIDFSKTYYKIQVGSEGIYRLPKTMIDGLGIPASVAGVNFILYREGQEVPMYVSTNGALGNNDYIEFYGRKADGNFDRELYENAAWQANERINMFTDTAAYFLTYDNGSNHLRYTAAPNNIPASPPAPLPYSIVTAGKDFLNEFLPGKHLQGQPHDIHLSLFESGEGYVAQYQSSLTQTTYDIATPNVYSAANARLKLTVLRNTYESLPMTMKLLLNNQQVADSPLAADATKKFDLNIAASLLSANNTITLSPTAPGITFDQYGLSFIEMRYPRNFDVSTLDFFSFELEASTASQYLEFLNFSSGGTAPRLYDLTNRKWYSGDISEPGKTKFYIDPSVIERKLLLYAENSSKILTISAAKTVNFTDYTKAANTGDYVLISHSYYSTLTNGHNYIADYKDYRSSVAGGSRTVVVANVENLYDQFAYGYSMHPLALKHFLKFAYDKWTVKPHDVFLVGKGLMYHKYRTFLQNSALYNFKAVVPTFGDPGSDQDFVNFLPNRMMAMNIARLSAWTPQDVGIYLEKVKSFETALSGSILPTHETELWKKRALHAAGGSSAIEQSGFLTTLNMGAAILTNPLFGGVVTTVAKNTTVPVDQSSNAAVDSLINNGLSFIVYHGHSSPNGFEFNLNTPEIYHNAPKLPHFLGLGCDVAQIFGLSSVRTISERYLLAPNGGSVSMIASNNLQFAPFHRSYLARFYASVSQRNFGKPIGQHHRFAYDSTRKVDVSDFGYMHIESMILQGDPAAGTYGPSKPDYHVAANSVSSIPVNITTTLDSFQLKITAYNLGKAINDTVHVKVEHINPANTVTAVKSYSIVNLYNTDTAYISFAVDKMADLGLNRYKITIDYDDHFDELNETNNSATFDVFIYSDNLVPVYPKEFSIVNKQNITLKASTLNPFRTVGTYRLEIDTTELFNSPLKQQTVISSLGGVIKWTPAINYQDSVVYYWRATFDSIVNGSYQWSYSSFIYLAAGSPGWNQSHYFQYLKNTRKELEYGTDRVFRFSSGTTEIIASNAIYDDLTPGWPWNDAAFSKVMFNGSDIQRLGCYPWDGTLQVMVFDSVTTLPWANDSTYGTAGAYPACNSGTRGMYAFEFTVFDAAGRERVRHFLDSIPNGNYVLIKNLINRGKYIPSFVSDWQTDPGPTNLYQELQSMGFNMIDSFTSEKAFIFFRKKGSNAYPVYQYIGNTILDTLVKTFELPMFRKQGEMSSTVIGPALQWQQLKWNFSAIDNQPQYDKPFVRIYGISNNNVNTLLYTGMAKDTSLSFISAAQYPNIRLTWTSYDSVKLTSPQLDYWRVLYSPLPEAALNPAAHFVFQDTLQAGQLSNFSVAIENLTEIPMDSMLVRYKIIDANNTTHILSNTRYKKLAGEDTLHAAITFDPSVYTGANVFFVEANPDNDQPEQYHPNNLGYLPFTIITDQRNPLIDVTFDGQHILDRDIVSAKPLIKISLKDENKYLRLDDTSLLKLRIRFPQDVNATTIPFDGVICKFIPAGTGEKNEAYIEYRPTFTTDGIYDLFVSGKDKTGNSAGTNDYGVSFEVVTKSSITHVLNYPNPFSTSTAFVFTLTGSEIPTQFKIQIMTVTGKVVKEITRQELGPIHIGRNITEYKWDGKDQYGQLLGNGVYLYRVVTAINGNSIEHRQNMDLKSYDGNSENDGKVDKFFKNGYGKMYIMR